MKNFYYLDKSGEVKGPFSSEQMRELNLSEKVSGATQVCEEGTENWMPYYQTAIGLPPRKQGPERKVHIKPKLKVQPESNWSINYWYWRASIKEDWKSIKDIDVTGCICARFVAGFLIVGVGKGIEWVKENYVGNVVRCYLRFFSHR